MGQRKIDAILREFRNLDLPTRPTNWDKRGLTPEDLGGAVRANSRKNSWVPSHILVLTRDYPEWRAHINAQDVLDAYETAISSEQEERAGLILSAVENDEYLGSELSPEYVREKFLDSYRTGDVRKAAFRLKSTENSPKARAQFTPEDIVLLLERSVCKGNFVPVLLILPTIDREPGLWERLYPQLIGQVFATATTRFIESEDFNFVKNPHYAHVALELLRYTTGRADLRSAIQEKDIQKLRACFESLRNHLPDNPFASNHIQRGAEEDIEVLDLCIKPPAILAELHHLADRFRMAADNSRRHWLGRRHPATCVDVLERHIAAVNRSTAPA